MSMIQATFGKGENKIQVEMPEEDFARVLSKMGKLNNVATPTEVEAAIFTPIESRKRGPRGPYKKRNKGKEKNPIILTSGHAQYRGGSSCRRWSEAERETAAMLLKRIGRHWMVITKALNAIHGNNRSGGAVQIQMMHRGEYTKDPAQQVKTRRVWSFGNVKGDK